MAELKLLPKDVASPTSTLLKAAGAGLTIASAVVAPNAPLLLAKQLGYDKNRSVLQSIRYALNKGWLTIEDSPTGVKVALSAAGRLKWQQIELSKPLFEKRWDGKWRVVLFDVPVSKKPAADAFRRALKKLGLKQLQRSVWVTPYECQSEAAVLRQIYGLKDHVRIAELVAIDDESSLKFKFKLP